MGSHYTYIIKCKDQTLYTGYTTDIKRRLEEHNSSETGAKYTRGRGPAILLHVEEFETKSEAYKREAEIKKLTRQQKLAMIAENA